MRTTLDGHALADLLPGSWTIAATNFPMWLNGERRNPRFSYELVSAEPLVLTDDVSYLTADDDEKHIVGTDTWRHGGFVWRGKGWLRFFASHWSVAGASEDGSILVIRFSKSMATPAGLDVVVREGTGHPELRALIARSTEQYGLSPEDFGSLTWLQQVPTGAIELPAL